MFMTTEELVIFALNRGISIESLLKKSDEELLKSLEMFSERLPEVREALSNLSVLSARLEGLCVVSEPLLVLEE